MSFPASSKAIEVKGNSYSVSFPTNRQLMAIYSRKGQLTKETFDSLSLSLDGDSRYIALLAEAIATFETIMPEQFLKDLNFTSIADSSVLIGAELVKIYRDQIEDWFNEWKKAIGEILNPKSEEKSKA